MTEDREHASVIRSRTRRDAEEREEEEEEEEQQQQPRGKREAARADADSGESLTSRISDAKRSDSARENERHRGSLRAQAAKQPENEETLTGSQFKFKAEI